jgi:hypothetical protein
MLNSILTHDANALAHDANTLVHTQTPCAFPPGHLSTHTPLKRALQVCAIHANCYLVFAHGFDFPLGPMAHMHTHVHWMHVCVLLHSLDAHMYVSVPEPIHMHVEGMGAL